MFGIGISELILVLIIALIFIDPEKLPDIAKAVGKTYADIRRASNEIKRTVSEAEPARPSPAAKDAPVKGAPPSVKDPPPAPLPSKGPHEPPKEDAVKKAD